MEILTFFSPLQTLPITRNRTSTNYWLSFIYQPTGVEVKVYMFPHKQDQ